MARSSTSEVLRAHCAAIAEEEAVLREGGGKAGQDRQHKMGRLPVRERIAALLDKDSPFLRNRALGRLQDVSGVGERACGGCGRRDRKRFRRSVHGDRERRDRKSRRFFPPRPRS